jgi:hypothetical protein
MLPLSCRTCADPQAEEKQQVELRLARLLEKCNSMIDATADLQDHILTLLLVVKQRLYPAVCEIGFQTLGRMPAVKAFLTEFLDHALLLKHPHRVLAIAQGSIKLPAHKTPQVRVVGGQQQGHFEHASRRFATGSPAGILAAPSLL